MISTARIKTFDGFQCLVPNQIIGNCSTHYISYNNHDTTLYGSDTTAIVLKGYFAGAMVDSQSKSDAPTTATQKLEKTHYHDVFLILNGKHDALIGMDLLECLEYFSKNIHLKAKYSGDLNEYLNYAPFWVKSTSGVYGCHNANTTV